MADFQIELVLVCEQNQPPTFFWFENPDHKRWSSPSSDELCRVDFCRFGKAWRKRTRVATNIEGLRGLRMLCTCSQAHVQLRGQHPTLKMPWTAVAQPHPRGFSKLIGSAVSSACNWSRWLNISACAHAGNLKIGEAKNPGLRLRHLVLNAQRKVPTLRPFASICWDLLCLKFCAGSSCDFAVFSRRGHSW